jgi:hypothetical protein
VRLVLKERKVMLDLKDLKARAVIQANKVKKAHKVK